MCGAYLSRYLRTDFESQLTCSPFWFTKADLNESKKLTASWTEYVFSSLSLAILEEESMLERNQTGTHFSDMDRAKRCGKLEGNWREIVETADHIIWRLSLKKDYTVNSIYIYIWNANSQSISRVKSEARFQALTRFAGHLALCLHM